MSELIKVTEQNGKQVVSARELHTFLEAGSNMNTWFKNQVDRAMLEDKIDFIQISEQSTGGRPLIDYAVSISSAKEIAMLNGGEKGKQARKYFIEMEKVAKDLLGINPPKRLPQTYSEALRELADKNDEIVLLQERNNKLEPRSLYFEKMINTDGLISMQEVAKLLNIPQLGRNKMYERLRIENVIMKNSTIPYQHFVNKGYFELKEDIIKLKNGVVKVNISTYVTQKGLAFIFKFFGLANKPLPTL